MCWRIARERGEGSGAGENEGNMKVRDNESQRERKKESKQARAVSILGKADTPPEHVYERMHRAIVLDLH